MNFPPGRRGMFRVSWGMTGKWGLENVENAKGTMASLLVETPVPRGGVKTKWIPGRFFSVLQGVRRVKVRHVTESTAAPARGDAQEP